MSNNYIHPESIIGKNTKVEPFSYIDADVEIGNNCWIGNNVTIYSGARIGNNVRIFPGEVISSIPQDLKFGGEKTTVSIGNYSTIREYVTISRGTEDKMTTSIGENCLIMAYSHIAHDCIIGNNVILVNNASLAGHVIIDDFAIIGALSGVHQFCRIGSHSFVAGGSLVRKDVPPYVKAAREPLSYVGINSVGLRRRGFENKKLHEIQNIYRLLYQKNYNNIAVPFKNPIFIST